jgi:hypothetical protein
VSAVKAGTRVTVVPVELGPVDSETDTVNVARVASVERQRPDALNVPVIVPAYVVDGLHVHDDAATLAEGLSEFAGQSTHAETD